MVVVVVEEEDDDDDDENRRGFPCRPTRLEQNRDAQWKRKGRYNKVGKKKQE